jgi:hypothetical protein
MSQPALQAHRIANPRDRRRLMTLPAVNTSAAINMR